MKLGVTFPQDELSGDPENLRRFALAAEELGYDHLLLYDHVVGAVRDVERPVPLPERGYDEKDPFHDPFVAFGYVAAITQRIELVTGILILPQRQTALVARQAADVQILSGGRLRLGVGVGYTPVEYDALGQPWSKRGRRLDEQVPFLRRLWSGEPVTFEGEPPPFGTEILNGDLRAGEVLSGMEGRAMASLRLDRIEGVLTVDGRPVTPDLPDWLKNA